MGEEMFNFWSATLAHSYASYLLSSSIKLKIVYPGMGSFS